MTWIKPRKWNWWDKVSLWEQGAKLFYFVWTLWKWDAHWLYGQIYWSDLLNLALSLPCHLIFYKQSCIKTSHVENSQHSNSFAKAKWRRCISLILIQVTGNETQHAVVFIRQMGRHSAMKEPISSGTLFLSELFLPVGKPISRTGWKSGEYLIHGLNWREFQWVSRVTTEDLFPADY